jgi:hypothetical protein
LPAGTDERRRQLGDLSNLSDLSDLPGLAAIFAATLWAGLHRMGVSPAVWQDTLIEDGFIDRCLHEDRCTIAGVGATVGIVHSAGYLHWRELLAWAGFGQSGTHVALLLVTAVGVTLVALTARRLDGPVAGGLAALLMTLFVGVSTQLNSITDLAPVPFLGALFLAVAVAATEAPSFRMTALLAVVGAITADTYATGLTLAVSAVWVAWMLPEWRWDHIAVAVATFVAATFVIAPGSWIADFEIVFSGGAGNAHPDFGHPLWSIRAVRFTLAAVLVWGVAAVWRRQLRAKLDVPVAIIVPIMVPMLLGTLARRLDPQEKYCSQALGAAAVCIAVGGTALVRGALAHPLFRRLPPFVSSARRWVPQAAPYVAALAIARSGMTYDAPLFTPPPTYADVAAMQHILGVEHGWTRVRATQNLRMLDDIAMAQTVGFRGPWPESGPEDPLERAYFFKKPTRLVPRPFPAGATIIETAGPIETVLAFTCSWIDWRSFRVCVKPPDGEEVCDDSSLPDDYSTPGVIRTPGMPRVDPWQIARQTMTVHLPLRPRPECPEEWVYMPRVPPTCVGHIVGVDAGDARPDVSGRLIKLRLGSLADGPAPKELMVAWELGTLECWNSYRGLPPFFIEGSPATVSFLRATLEARR